VDHERETDATSGDKPAESDPPATAGDEGATTADETTSSADAAAESAESAEPAAAAAESEAGSEPSGGSMPDLGSDADILNDAFEAGPRPPEWPSADLAHGDDEADEAAGASDTAMDMGDDSDAPILADAAAAPADHVDLTQAGAQSITAASVTLSQGGVGQVHADEMHVQQSGVGLARVGTLTLGDGASAFAVVADQATVEEGSNAFLVIARSLDGDVRPTIDWRGALAFGAGVALVLSIIRRLR
jgi:hypothetical protein